MKKLTYIFVLFVAASLAFTGCKKGNPAGTYKLDKEAMAKAAQAKIDKITDAKKKAFAGMALAMIKMLDVQLVLKADGSAEMITTRPSLFKKGEMKTKKETGTWKLDGKQLTITTKGKTTKTTACEFTGKSIQCADPKGKSKDKMVFLRS